MSTDKPSVIIVGGGVIGCCTAYHLAAAGAQVTLLERDSLCAEASSAAAGLNVVSSRKGLLLRLVLDSSRFAAEDQQELETDFEVTQRGTLSLLRTEEELSKQRTFVETQRALGLKVDLLDREAALKIEPQISPDIVGAVYSPIDGSASPYLMTLAYAIGARRLGATIQTGTQVTGLQVVGSRVSGAVTPDGVVPGDFVVLAAGAWSPLLARQLDVNVPVEPGRGQVLVTEAMPGITKTIIKDTGHIHITPTARGNYVIGSMTEKVGFNKDLTVQRLRESLHEAAEMLPALKRARIIRAWAGLRPLSPDDMPILGPVDGHEGLMLATGHSRLGTLLAPITGRIMADLIVRGTTPYPLEALSVHRFAA